MTAQDRQYMTPTEEQLAEADLFPERAQEKRIAELEAENRQLCELVNRLESIESDIAELREDYECARKAIKQLQGKLLYRPPIEQLTKALMHLLIVMTTIPYKTYGDDQDEHHRQVIVGVEQMAQDALMAGGLLYPMPSAKIAWEHALRVYHDHCNRK